MSNKKLFSILVGVGLVAIIGVIIYTKYNRSGAFLSTTMHHGSNVTLAALNRSTTGLPEAQPQQVATLHNGQVYDLTAAFVKKNVAGRSIRMLSYNNQIPGPVFQATQGDTITVNFNNELDEDTTIHWHGIRLENKFDGVPDSTHPPVKPGERFAYTVKLPDPGLYWFHPHTREDYEQELGLYGLIWVKPQAENYFNKVHREEFVILDDILLEQNDVAPFAANQTNYALMGRFGNTLFINGQDQYNLSVQKNEVIRFAILNAANTRPFKLAIPGVKLKLVGADAGVYDQESLVESVIISPSERALVEVLFDKPGTYQLVNQTPQASVKLGTISVTPSATDIDYATGFYTLRTGQLPQARVLLQEYRAKEVDQTINLTLQTQMSMGEHMSPGMMHHGASNTDSIEWEDSMPMMNENSTSNNLTWIMQDAATKKENMDVRYSFKKGSYVKIRLFNDPDSAHPMQHPIHLHGNRFLTLSVNGVQSTNPVWKDTVLVPTGATVDILLDASNPGIWMAHCHISEHLQSKMMILYEVI